MKDSDFTDLLAALFYLGFVGFVWYNDDENLDTELVGCGLFVGLGLCIMWPVTLFFIAYMCIQDHYSQKKLHAAKKERENANGM